MCGVLLEPSNISQQLICYLKSINLLSKNQYGFIKYTISKMFKMLV